MSLLAVKNLTVHFKVNGKTAKAVDGVTFKIENDQTLALVGESGCGKTVTAMSILRLLPHQSLSRFSGNILFNDVDLQTIPEKEIRKFRGSQIAMIFQEPMTSLNPVLTVGFQISEVLTLHQSLKGKKAKDSGLALLEKVGIRNSTDIWEAYPGQLSGGMRQRVMIAMAMAGRPKLLIADEPTTALDVTVQAKVLSLIQNLKKDSGMGILLVTHDLGIVAEACDKVCIMYSGRIVESGPVEQIFKNPLHPYTKGLLKAINELDKREIKVAIKGQVESATNFPEGCRFHPRCPEKMSICEKEYPALVKFEEIEVACHLFNASS